MLNPKFLSAVLIIISGLSASVLINCNSWFATASQVLQLMPWFALIS